MPKGARVFLVEDNDDFRRYEREVLRKHGHSVVLEASTPQQAQIELKFVNRQKVNVAVLDGSLSDSLIKEGSIIARDLRKKIPGIKIVACTGILANWGHENIKKDDVAKLGGIVTKL